jgi:hypothetical protein
MLNENLKRTRKLKKIKWRSYCDRLRPKQAREVRRVFCLRYRIQVSEDFHAQKVANAAWVLFYCRVERWDAFLLLNPYTTTTMMTAALRCFNPLSLTDSSPLIVGRFIQASNSTCMCTLCSKSPLRGVDVLSCIVPCPHGSG